MSEIKSTKKLEDRPIETISQRIHRTKTDIGKLKAELQELIDCNKSDIIGNTKITPEIHECHENLPPTSPIRAPQHKSPSKPLAKVTNQQSNQQKIEKKPPVQKSFELKSNEARDFMRKKKHLRATEIKSQIVATDNQLDLKKQRLKELHKKTLELVSKNVQMKRERSKSRERVDLVRLDKVTVIPQAVPHSRCRSRERPQPQSTCSKKHPYPEPDLSKITFRGQVQDRIGAFEKQSNIRNQASKNKTKSQPNLDRLGKRNEQKSPRGRSQERGKNVLLVAKCAKINGHEKTKSKSQPDLPSSGRIKEQESSKIVEVASQKVSKSSGHGSGDSVSQSKLPVSVQNKDTKTNSQQMEPVSLQVTGLNGTITHVADFRPQMPEQQKETKETQTRKLMKLRDPPWLQKSSTNPDHYNFINTVKRKIQYNVRSPVQRADIGVQNSPFTPQTDAASHIKQALKEEIQKTPKSFPSHNIQNLDLEAVSNLELLSNRITESDSDTSKNIPEISSESIDFKLNLEPVANLKLDIRRDPNNLAADGASYTSDFNSAFSTNINSLDDSLISLNMPAFNLMKKSPKSIKRVDESSQQATLKSPQLSYITDIPTEKRVQNTITITNTFGNEKKKVPSAEMEKSESMKTLLSITSKGSKSPQEKLAINKASKKSSSSTSVESNASDKKSLGSIKNREENETTSESLKTPSRMSPSSSSKESSPNSIKSTGTTKSIAETDSEKSSRSVIHTGYEKEKKSLETDSNLFLKPPAVSLSVNQQKREYITSEQMKNITIRPKVTSQDNVNEIHLKFEAEVRLLNDCNEYFKQFRNLEQAYIAMTNSNNNLPQKVVQNENTQTPLVGNQSEERFSMANYSRDSDTITKFLDSSRYSDESKTLIQINDSVSEDNTALSLLDDTRFNDNLHCAGISLNMFEHLIRDEDSRIKHLKTIIKIREQSLLDRTKTELRWLEIQRKQLIETGRVDEASLIKKKQRGIILKHEQERCEIKRLKQMQQEESKQRKKNLKEQKNLIKSQLSTGKNMLSKIKNSTPRERRSCAPLRVVQSCSETSISRKNSTGEEIFSIKSQSITLSEEFDSSNASCSAKADGTTNVSDAKRTLYMREAELQKRRKVAEELLQWHRKLLDEEKKITQLEAAATSVINNRKNDNSADTERQANSKRYFSGKELNKLWRDITASEEEKFADNRNYEVSEQALERFFKSAKQQAQKSRRESGRGDSDSVADSTKYSSVFEPASKISSISELIENLSKIEGNISSLSRKSETIVTGELQKEISDMPTQISELNSVQKLQGKEVDEIHEENKENSIMSSSQYSTQSRQTVSTPKPIDLSKKSSSDSERIMDEVPNTSGDTSGKFSNTENMKSVGTIEEMGKGLEELSSEKHTPVFPEDGEDLTSSTETVIHSLKENERRLEENNAISNTSDAIEKSIHISSESSKGSNSCVTSSEDPEEIIENIAPDEEVESLEDKDEKVSEETNHDTKLSEDLVTKEEISTVTKTIDEALEAASNIEESLTKINAKLASNSSEISEQIDLTEVSSSTPIVEPVELININKETSEREADSTEYSASFVKVSTESNKHEAGSSSLSSSPDTTSDESQSSGLESKKQASINNEDEKSASQSSIATEEPSVSCSKSEGLSISTSRTDSFIPQLDLEEKSLSQSLSSDKTSSKKSAGHLDVKRRVSEILADVSSPVKGDITRMQEFYVTSYDISPTSPEAPNEQTEDKRIILPGSLSIEAEELLRQQLAIEQEIKQLEQQQQRGQIPYLYMREIPNKPPPPYTPPAGLPISPPSLLPQDVKGINEITNYSSKILFKAFQNKNLYNVKYSEKSFRLYSKLDLSNICAEFMFNICKELAHQHYKQYEMVEEPLWFTFSKHPELKKSKPMNAISLERFMNRKLKELFGFRKPQVAESANIRWSRKKRDHVDEILVTEAQEEETQWTNFDKEELIVKDQINNYIMNMLLRETADVFSKIIAKRNGDL